MEVGSPPTLTGIPIVWVATSDNYCSRLFENHLLGSEYTESPLSAWCPPVLSSTSLKSDARAALSLWIELDSEVDNKVQPKLLRRSIAPIHPMHALACRGRLTRLRVGVVRSSTGTVSPYGHCRLKVPTSRAPAAECLRPRAHPLLIAAKHGSLGCQLWLLASAVIAGAQGTGIRHSVAT